jgi:hypothetical protein
MFVIQAHHIAISPKPLDICQKSENLIFDDTPLEPIVHIRIKECGAKDYERNRSPGWNEENTHHRGHV